MRPFVSEMPRAKTHGEYRLMWSAVPGILHPVLDCLLKFKAVVNGCFSWTLVPDYAEKIKAFSQDYSDLMTYAEVSLYCH